MSLSQHCDLLGFSFNGRAQLAVSEEFSIDYRLWLLHTLNYDLGSEMFAILPKRYLPSRFFPGLFELHFINLRRLSNTSPEHLQEHCQCSDL